MGRPYIDETGNKYGKWTVISPVKQPNGRIHWLCQCECGNSKIVNGNSLRKGESKSCGCALAIDLRGMTFGRLTVLRRVENKGINVVWECKCSCGNCVVVKTIHLRNAHTKSCGCLNKEMRTESAKKHGLSTHRLYHIYSSMKDRCLNPKNNKFDDYGGRGIEICQEWLDDFMSFYNWSMENGYDEKLSIDRTNVNGNYEPSNCRWATPEQQATNKRNNHLVTINGVTKAASLWAKETGLHESVIRKRHESGYQGEEIIKPLKEEYSVEINGETITLLELSEKTGLKYATLLRRFHEGKRGDVLISKPNTSQQLRINIDGVVKTLEEWSLISGIKKITLHSRYHQYGWRGKDLLKPVDTKKRRKGSQ